jgi:hypothetical protein
VGGVRLLGNRDHEHRWLWCGDSSEPCALAVIQNLQPLSAVGSLSSLQGPLSLPAARPTVRLRLTHCTALRQNERAQFPSLAVE